MIQFDLRIFFKWVGKKTRTRFDFHVGTFNFGPWKLKRSVSSLVHLPCRQYLTSDFLFTPEQWLSLIWWPSRVGSCTWSQVFDDLNQSKKLLFDTRKSGFQVWPGNFWYQTQAKIRRTNYILLEMVEFERIQCIFRFHGIPDFQTHPRLLLKLMWCFCPGLQGGVLAKWWTSTWDRHLGFKHVWLLSLAMFDFWSFILV